MSNTNYQPSFALRQTLSPVLFQPVIGALVLSLLVIAELKVHGLDLMAWDWRFVLVYVGGGTVLCLSWARDVRSYRVYWKDGSVGMHTVGAKQDVVIPADNITLVREETSLERGRVFRRIAIYAHSAEDKATFVDVSLKHFVPDDIRKLMRAIHEKRPDLQLPEHWL